MYSLKDKSGRTMTDHAKSEPEAILKAWEYADSEFQGTNLCIDSKENHLWHVILAINYDVASQFHPIKIMIFHWQRIDETNQSTRRWSFRLTSGSRSDDYINLDDETVLCMSSSLKGKCQLHAVTQWVQSWYVKWHPYRIQSQHDIFYFHFWVTMNHWLWLDVPESPKNCS